MLPGRLPLCTRRVSRKPLPDCGGTEPGGPASPAPRRAQKGHSLDPESHLCPIRALNTVSPGGSLRCPGMWGKHCLTGSFGGRANTFLPALSRPLSRCLPPAFARGPSEGCHPLCGAPGLAPPLTPTSGLMPAHRALRLGPSSRGLVLVRVPAALLIF